MKSCNRKRHSIFMALASVEHKLCSFYALAACNYAMLGQDMSAMHMDSNYQEALQKYADYIAMASNERR